MLPMHGDDAALLTALCTGNLVGARRLAARRGLDLTTLCALVARLGAQTSGRHRAAEPFDWWHPAGDGRAGAAVPTPAVGARLGSAPRHAARVGPTVRAAS